MAFVGFEFAGHWEKYLIEELQKKAGALFFALPAGDAQPEHLVYSDPEQEITGLMENLVIAVGEYAPHEIAVVLCDSKFTARLFRTGSRIYSESLSEENGQPTIFVRTGTCPARRSTMPHSCRSVAPWAAKSETTCSLFCAPHTMVRSPGGAGA